MRSRIWCLSAALLLSGLATAQDVAPLAKTKDGKSISPKGQSADAREGELSNQPPRYYVWIDPQGWHIRSAAKEGSVVKFEGTITLTDGEFGRLRPIGLESKGKYADKWAVDASRRKMEFTIFTSGSFDGLDFTVSKAKDAQVLFDLKIGGKPAPGRVFIGKDGQHPAEAAFALPAEAP